MIAGACGVRLAEIAKCDRPVDSADDLRQRDLFWLPCEDIAAANATLGSDDAGTLESEKNLLEVRLGESGALSDLSDRGRAVSFRVQRQREECPRCVVSPGRNLHEGDLTCQRPATRARARRPSARRSRPPSIVARMEPKPIAPAYGQGCLTDLVPAMLGPGGRGAIPANGGASVPVNTAEPMVLLVLDGLGWDQLLERPDITPVLTSMEGAPITSVAPSTTATALTSITTGLTPGEHGIVGYRMMIDGDVLNALRWGSKALGDCRRTLPPDSLQPYEPFLGERVDYVSKAEFAKTGFTGAHLRGAHLHGYRTTAVMVSEIGRVVREGAPFVYAYYDGVDKVAHEYGLDARYDAEVSFVDRLVGDVIAAVPSGTQVFVTADHGQVDCGHDLRLVADDVLELTESLSGEARFRWLHARRGSETRLLDAANEAHSRHAWVRSLEQMIDEGWLGPTVRSEVLDRYGSVALLPFEPFGFDDPDDSGPFDLIGRHGSLTSAEMLVPLLLATA